MTNAQHAITRISVLLKKLSPLGGADFVWRFTNTNLLRHLPKEQQEHRCLYCRKIKRKPCLKLKECIIHHRENTVRRALKIRKPFFMTCHAALTEVVVPIFINDRYRGSIFAGPFAAASEPPYSNVFEAYRILPKFNKEKAEALAEMVSEILEAFKTEFSEIGNDSQLLPELQAQDHRIFQAASFMRSKFRGPLSVESVAGSCNMSPSRFMHLFRQETNFTFSDYLQRLRVNEARQLLEATNLSIGEIAIEAGINSQSRLTVLFRRYYGKQPKECRTVQPDA